jgi:hypothetical protein
VDETVEIPRQRRWGHARVGELEAGGKVGPFIGEGFCKGVVTCDMVSLRCKGLGGIEESPCDRLS